MTSETSAGAEAGLEAISQEIPSLTDSSEANPVAELPKFDTLGLSPEVMRAITESGYTTPTPIQAQSIPHVLKGKDIIGIAQTGTGKTASFTLPMIELLARGRAKARMPRSLILEPTRELAAQVAESFERYGKYNKLSMALLIGGVSFEDQEKKLDRGVDVLIATPGRLLDHFGRGKLMLSQVQVLVIDEADRMLDMGFVPDVEKICKLIPFTRQTLFYSATMPPEIQRLTEQFLQAPVRVEVSRPATAASTITQQIVEVPHNDWAKREALRRLIRDNPVNNGIIFCNRKRDVDVVARSLSKHGFNAAPLHGDLEQSTRMKTLEAFKSGEIQLLVASDVAARGLDIPAVSHVFNFDVPYHADDYVHRIGRTGRAGRLGFAFMLASRNDQKAVDAIEKLLSTSINRTVMADLEVREDLQQRGRSNDRSRREGGRGRSRERRPRDPVPHGHEAAMEPAKAMPAAEVAPVMSAEPVVKQAHSDKTESAARQEPIRHASRPARNASNGRDKPARADTKTQKPRVQGEKPDISELPAFLLRPVKFPSSEPRAAKKNDDADLNA